MKGEGELTNADHKQMDAFLSAALNDYKNGDISLTTAVNCLAHVIAAVDLDNYSEARSWFQNPEFLRETQKRI